MAMDDEEEDCALCGGPCTVADEHGEATVTAADVDRLEQIGVLKRVSPEEIAAFELRQRGEMRLKYGTDDPCEAMRMIVEDLAVMIGHGSGRES